MIISCMRVRSPRWDSFPTVLPSGEVFGLNYLDWFPADQLTPLP